VNLIVLPVYYNGIFDKFTGIETWGEVWGRETWRDGLKGG
jgi:hypothetical protein